MALRWGLYVEASRSNLVNHKGLGITELGLPQITKTNSYGVWRFLNIKIGLSLEIRAI